MNPDAWHYVRLNDASRYPRRIICLDAESQRAVTGDIERHSFMLAVASFDQISPQTRAPKRTDWLETTDPLDLWDWISGHCKPRERTCLFAHNLGYDLRITSAFTALPALGWKLKFISLDNRRCYARWSRQQATLSLSDSMSYFPRSLDVIAQELGMRKTALPGIGENPDKYFARCRTDVDILRAAILQLLGWLEGNNCGNFKPTGPAQAWTTYRHKFLKPRSVLVHQDDEAREAEREAGWTGRTEALRHGEFHYPLQEWDYRLAYATIAADCHLPRRLLGSRMVGGPLQSLPRTPNTVSLCSVRVTTKTPTVPARMGNRITWPVGTFQTVLWDVEAELALRGGATVEVDRCWRYLTGPILKDWGEWVIRQLSDDTLPTPPLIRIMLKHWARCMIGRFGMRYPDWRFIGSAEVNALQHFDCYDHDDGSASEYLQIGADMYSCDARRDGFDTLPAVMSYIMALQRVKLWEAMQAAGLSDVFYVDTDSLLVTPAGGKALAKLRTEPDHHNLLPKQTYDHSIIYGPRQIVLDGDPRIAGLPRRAVATGRRNYKATSWQSLSDSLKSGDPSTVRVSPRSFTVSNQDSRRKHLTNGHTEPFVLYSVA